MEPLPGRFGEQHYSAKWLLVLDTSHPPGLGESLRPHPFGGSWAGREEGRRGSSRDGPTAVDGPSGLPGS